MAFPVAPPTALRIEFVPSSSLDTSVQRSPQTVVAFLICGAEDALAAPTVASPKVVVMAADAASTQSPLVKRYPMMIPSVLGLARLSGSP